MSEQKSKTFTEELNSFATFFFNSVKLIMFFIVCYFFFGLMKACESIDDTKRPISAYNESQTEY